MYGERIITVNVLACHKDQALVILKEYQGSPDDDGPFTPDPKQPEMWYIQDWGRNISNFNVPLLKLQAKGIAYDFGFGRSDDDDSQRGEDRLRFTHNGEADLKGWLDEDKHLKVADLMALRDDPTQLIATIEEASQKTETLGWLQQEEYGRRYQAAQLLLPKTST